jgi:hypothetical protein
MVLIDGLDRLDTGPLAGMSDELWALHTDEVRRAFEEQARCNGANALGFKDYCAGYADGSRSTAAMREHRAAARKRLFNQWVLPATLATVLALGVALVLASRHREAQR